MIECREITDIQEWLVWRGQDATASDVAALCGYHPKRTPMQVYADKLGVSAYADSNIMRRGRWLQAAFIEAFKDIRPGLKLEPCKSYYRDAELRIGATPDFFAVDENGDRGIVEAKVVAWPEFKKNWLSFAGDYMSDPDEVVMPAETIIEAPLQYQFQAMTQFKLTELFGMKWAMIAAMTIDAYHADIFQVPVVIEDLAWDVAKREVKSFWKHFDDGTLPELRPELDAKAIAAIYREPDGRPAIDLSANPRARQLFKEWAAQNESLKLVKEDTKPIEAELKRIKTELCALLGNADTGVSGDYTVTWKLINRKAVAATQFRQVRVSARK